MRRQPRAELNGAIERICPEVETLKKERDLYLGE